jgi:penicillin-binding protein 1A
METLLVKIFAAALALSEVTTAPDTVATRFDRVADQAAVGELLRGLCPYAQGLRHRGHRECVHYYPFVLGAQPVRPVDLAAFYAAIANEGMRRAPYVIDSIERNGLVVYRHDPKSFAMIESVDRAAFYQLKSMMQGVLARGTARSIAHLAPFVAGKTGTSDDENDAWFVGFSNDVTVAVWLGYDNSDGKRRTLGGGATGGGVAVPIFEPVMRAVWAHVAPKIALAPPSPEAKRQLSCKSVDRDSDEVQRGGTECFRISANGKIIDTKYRLISRAYAKEDGEDREERPSRRFRHRREEERPSRYHKVYAQSRYLWRGWQPWSWGWPWR